MARTVTWGLGVPSKILVHSGCELSKTLAEIPGSWKKQQILSFSRDLFLFVIQGQNNVVIFSPSFSSSPSWPSSHLLLLLLSSLTPPCSLLHLPPSSSSCSSFSSLSTPAPDLVPSWLACLQQDSGCLPVAGRHRQRTRPGKGQEERGLQRGSQQQEGGRHGGL